MRNRALAASSAGMTLFLLFAAGTAAADKGKWEYVTTDQGVRVSVMEVENSPLKAFRGEITTDLHIGQVMAVFLDGQQRQHWVDRYKEHQTFERTDEREVYWIHFALPWPVSDRDYVLEAMLKPDADKRVVTCNIQSVEHPKKGEDSCCVRAKAYRTYYRFEAIPGEKKTKLEVEVHTDPQGLLPDWLINLIQKSWPSKTLGGLVAQARTQKPHLEYLDWHDAPGEAAARTATSAAANVQ